MPHYYGHLLHRLGHLLFISGIRSHGSTLASRGPRAVRGVHPERRYVSTSGHSWYIVHVASKIRLRSTFNSSFTTVDISVIVIVFYPLNRTPNHHHNSCNAVVYPDLEDVPVSQWTNDMLVSFLSKSLDFWNSPLLVKVHANKSLTGYHVAVCLNCFSFLHRHSCNPSFLTPKLYTANWDSHLLFVFPI
jgi:hypothetical protein